MLRGKTVIVTGAASGIGLASCVRLSKEGAVVLAADINLPTGESAKTIKQLQDSFGLRFVRGDVGKARDCENIVKAAVELGKGSLDGLVNNAGMGCFDVTVETCPQERWERVLAVNLTSVFLLSKFAIPHLRARGGGCIVNVASVHALSQSPTSAAYAASKGGVLALTRQMAVDFAKDNIRVVALCPGAIDTPMGPPPQQGWTRDKRTLGHIGEPQQIASIIAFLLSDDAALIQGTSIVADNGLLTLQAAPVTPVLSKL